MQPYIEYDPRYSDPLTLQHSTALGRIPVTDLPLADSLEPVAPSSADALGQLPE